MDDHRFDDLARSLAISRRAALKTVAGGLVGGLLAVVERERAGAFICRQPTATCSRDAHCCSGKCVNYQCACPEDQLLCGRTCAQCCSDGDCASTARCGDGVCVDACTPTCDGTTCGANDGCGGICTSGPCAGDLICANGTCVCPGGTTPCNGTSCCPSGQPCTANGCCTPTTCATQGVSCGTISDNCGGTLTCGSCQQCETCAAGHCQATGTRCGNQCCAGDTPTCCPDGTCVAADGCCSASECPASDCAAATCTAGQCGTTPLTGQACGTGPTCGNGQAKAQDTCGDAGTCVTGDTTACAPYICGDHACRTSCDSDGDCAADTYCSGGKCVPKQDDGAACDTAGQCQHGFCVDGVCCNTACTDQCAACNVPDRIGTCSPAPAGSPVGDRQRCAGEIKDCDGRCDGKITTCVYPAGQPCGGPSCADSSLIPGGNCSGIGTCKPLDPIPCAPYGCNSDGTACLASCAGDGDCASGYVCNASHQCFKCTRDCTGKCGGADDGCGGTCDACPSGQTCTDSTCCGNLQRSCTDVSQCCQDLPASCETVGTGTETQCCRQPPIVCSESADCCGDAVCDTVLWGTPGYPYCCLPEGHTCDRESDYCCGDLFCSVDQNVCCDQTYQAGDCGDVVKCGVVVHCGDCANDQVCHNGTCCVPEPAAQTCDSHHLCGPVVNNCGEEIYCSCDPSVPSNCDNGICVACTPLGGNCGPDFPGSAECCQSDGDTTYCVSGACCHQVTGYCQADIDCCSSGHCDTEFEVCCYVNGHFGCTSSDECCGVEVCAANQCCLSIGWPCDDDNGNECCSGVCLTGQCACGVAGTRCASDDDCCDVDGTCCNGFCRSVNVDSYNCGSCGHDCGTDFAGDRVPCCAGLPNTTCCAHV